MEGRRLRDRLRNGVLWPAVVGLEARQRHRNEFTGLQVGPQDEAAVGDEIDLALPHHRPIVREAVGNRKEAVAPSVLRHREDVRKLVLPGCGIEVVAADCGGTGTIKDLAWIARQRRGAGEEFRAAKPLVENCAVRRHVGDPPQPAAGLAPFDDVEPALFRGDAIGRQVGDFGEAVGEVRPRHPAAFRAIALLQLTVGGKAEDAVVGIAVGHEERLGALIPGESHGRHERFRVDENGLRIVGPHPHDPLLAQHEERAVCLERHPAGLRDFHLADLLARGEIEPADGIMVAVADHEPVAAGVEGEFPAAVMIRPLVTLPKHVETLRPEAGGADDPRTGLRIEYRHLRILCERDDGRVGHPQHAMADPTPAVLRRKPAGRGEVGLEHVDIRRPLGDR